MARLIRICIPLLILVIGVIAWRVQVKDEPEEKPKPWKRPEVETTVELLKRVDFPVVIETQGTVQAQNETSVTAGISGRVMKTSPVFETGAFFQKGDILLTLDDADYQSALAAAEARVARAEADLVQEQASSRQALLNWKDLGYKEPPSDLVLRKPQLRQTEASVKAALADLAQAQRDLERTVVRSPYNGRTRERSVSPGQSIGATTPLGIIFSTDIAEIRLPLTALQRPFVTLPEKSDDSTVDVTLLITSGDDLLERKAQVVRTEGVLDETTRELFVIAEIQDPFALSNEAKSLRIGQPVRARLRGHVLEDVFVIPRKHMRSLDEVIIITAEENTIQRREVKPVWSTSELLVVRHGFTEGEMMATSPLTYAPEGGKVTVIETTAPAILNASSTEQDPGA